MSDVLVLNKQWVPIKVTTIFDALTKVYQDKASIVTETYEMCDLERWIDDWKDAKDIAEDFIHTPSIKIKKPKIIVLRNYKGYVFKKIKLNRKNVYARDDYQCQYCGLRPHKSKLNIDHVIPKAKGGKTVWTNIAVSCRSCNQKKGDKYAHEVGMKLLRKPRKPSWDEVHKESIRMNYRHWKDLLGDLYWNVELEK